MDARISLLVFVLSISIGVVCSQIVITSGESGELCGTYHRCLSNSTCLKTRGNFLCACPEPLTGNAKLGCVSKESATVYIQNDPHLKNLFHQFLTVSTPCRYRVMEFYSDNLYVVRVYVEHLMYKGGNFYANQISVQMAKSSAYFTSEPDESKLTWSSVSIIGDTVSQGHYEFREWRSVLALPDGIEMYTEYDETNNLAIIKAPGVGLKVWLRPLDRHALQEDSPCMTQVPGVVITVDGDFLGRTQFSTADLSSTPSGPDLKVIAAALRMDLDLYALWLTIINTEDSAAGSESCKDVNRNFKQVCTTDDSQAQAIKVCGQIYTDQKLRECLDYQGLTAEFMNHIFKDCMRAICEKDRVWCKVTKSHIMERHCKVPRSLAQFDCDSLKDVEHLEPNSTSDLAEQTEHSFYRLHHQLPVPE